MRCLRRLTAFLMRGHFLDEVAECVTAELVPLRSLFDTQLRHLALVVSSLSVHVA